MADISPPAIADARTYLADVVAQLERAWPDNRTVNIICHGNSVPAGYFNTPMVDTFNAYPHLVHLGLKQRFPHAVINVIVTAIGSETSDLGAGRFARDVLPLRPDVVLIDYALTDRRIGLELARQSWARMIEQSLAAGAVVILLTPTGDTAARMDDLADPLNQHARRIRQLAAEYRIGLADSLAAFQAHIASGGKLEDLLSQSNHPNRCGHELVAEAVLEWFPQKGRARIAAP
jgi:hypothetical protein